MTREIDIGRLGTVSEEQLQAALTRFELGTLVRASAVPFGLFGQNVFVESDVGSYVLRLGAHFAPYERALDTALLERRMPTPG